MNGIPICSHVHTKTKHRDPRLKAVLANGKLSRKKTVFFFFCFWWSFRCASEREKRIGEPANKLIEAKTTKRKIKRRRQEALLRRGKNYRLIKSPFFPVHSLRSFCQSVCENTKELWTWKNKFAIGRALAESQTNCSISDGFECDRLLQHRLLQVKKT